MIHEFLFSFVTFLFIYFLVAVSLNLTIGFTGLVNLGHMVFFGVGAYTSAILTINGVPWYFAIIVAGVVASILGAIIASITVRLKGDYFAMVTLGLVFIAIAVSRNWISLTRGALGLPGIPDIFRNNFYYTLFTIGVVTIAIIIIYFLTNSETGKIFQAIRDDETATAILGKNTYFYKILSVAISTFFAGIAGSLFAHHLNFIDPTLFDLELFVFILAILISGGLASIKGTIVAGFILSVLITLLRFVVVTPELIGPMRNMLFLVILILILIYRPRGIFGRVDV